MRCTKWSKGTFLYPSVCYNTCYLPTSYNVCIHELAAVDRQRPHFALSALLTCMRWKAVDMYACMNACMYARVCMYAYESTCVCVCRNFLCLCSMYTRMQMCLCIYLFVCIYCALEAVGSSPHKTCSHKTYTTIGTGWSHYPARQQATTSAYRWLEGVARCKHKCVCMCMYLRMYVCTMLYACMCVLCMHVYVCMHVCVYVCHASVCACVCVCM